MQMIKSSIWFWLYRSVCVYACFIVIVIGNSHHAPSILLSLLVSIAFERTKQTDELMALKRWEWKGSLTTQKKKTRMYESSQRIQSNSYGCEQIHRMHYTTFYSHSLVCQHNSKYRHPRHSFIHSNIAIFFFLSIFFSRSVIPLILFFHICSLFSDSALWRSLAIVHSQSLNRMGKWIQTAYTHTRAQVESRTHNLWRFAKDVKSHEWNDLKSRLEIYNSH